jgi:hypothetical protein
MVVPKLLTVFSAKRPNPLRGGNTRNSGTPAGIRSGFKYHGFRSANIVCLFSGCQFLKAIKSAGQKKRLELEAAAPQGNVTAVAVFE